MQKKNGNKLELPKNINLIYSHKKNLLLLIKHPLAFLLIVIFIIVIFTLFYEKQFLFKTYKFFLYIFGITTVFSILSDLPNFFRDKKYCRKYQIRIINDEFILYDDLKNQEISLQMKSLIRYTIINFTLSLYQAIQLDFKNDKRIVIYKTMKNYERLKNYLKDSDIKGTDYIYKKVGKYIENIY